MVLAYLQVPAGSFGIWCDVAPHGRPDFAFAEDGDSGIKTKGHYADYMRI